MALIGIGGFVAGRISSSSSGSEASDDRLAGQRVTSARADGRSSEATSSERGTRGSRDTKSSRAGQVSFDKKISNMEAIVRGANPLSRNRALLDFIDQLEPGEFEGAIAHFRSMGITDSRMGEYSLLLTAWAERDPTAALQYATVNTRGSFARDTILTAWATTDPEAAVLWANGNFDGDGPNHFIPGILRGIAATDPGRATQLLTEMPMSGERGRGLDFMLPHFLEQGEQATRDWISSLGDTALINGAILRVADRLARTDPQATVDWMIANPGEGSRRRMDDVYQTWARTDMNSALSSITSMAAGDAKTDALRGVVSVVSSQDAKEGLALMNRFPNEVNDRVVRDFVWNSFRNDPATTVGEIARVENPGERERMYRRTLESWMERDPVAAGNWAANNVIPDSVRNFVNRRLSEPR